MSNQNQQLVRTIEQLYAHAPGFERRMKDAGLTPADIQTADDLARLPVLRKDDLINLQRENPPFGEMLAVPIDELRTVFQSPGPINEPGVKVADAHNWAVALRAAGFEAGEMAFDAFSYHLIPAGHTMQDGLEAVGCVTIPGGVGNKEQQVAAIRAYEATAYVGLPSYLKALLDTADELGVELPLNKALVLAEPLPESLRMDLAERGVTALQAFGTAECGNLAYETPALDGWHVPDNVILQICDVNTGEPLPAGDTGEVVVTLLRPYYAATVRFGVGDLSNIIPRSLDDAGPMRIAGWQGRVGAATKVRGMFLHPQQVAAMMARFPEVDRYEMVVTRQDHMDHLTLRVVAPRAADDLVERLAQTARDAIKFRLNAVVVPADDLPADADFIRDERDWA